MAQVIYGYKYKKCPDAFIKIIEEKYVKDYF